MLNVIKRMPLIQVMITFLNCQLQHYVKYALQNACQSALLTHECVLWLDSFLKINVAIHGSCFSTYAKIKNELHFSGSMKTYLLAFF